MLDRLFNILCLSVLCKGDVDADLNRLKVKSTESRASYCRSCARSDIYRSDVTVISPEVFTSLD